MTDAPLTPGTVAVPGAVLAFSVRGDLADATPDSPPLVLAGSPMDSTGFVSLAAGIPARRAAGCSCSPTRATSAAAPATRTPLP